MRYLLCLLLLAACTTPGPEAYMGDARQAREVVDLGANEVGEVCTQAAGARGSAEIFCGAWQQPSARVHDSGAATDSSLRALVTASPWRSTLDSGFACASPVPASFAAGTGFRLDCTRRNGGWPHVAVGVLAGGQAFLAEGVVSSLPAIERSIEVMSGRAKPRIVPRSAVAALQAERGGARARASGDVREYDSLLAQGTEANLADNPAAAEAAYSAALALMEKARGRDDPNVAEPAMLLALQVSNQGRYAEADALFARVEKLAARQKSDPGLTARLLHYEGLHALNQGKNEAALALLQRADAAYRQAVPREALEQRPVNVGSNFANTVAAGFSTLPVDSQTRLNLTGLVEVKRYEGIVLRSLGRGAESEAALRSAAALARQTGLERPRLTARLARSNALTALVGGNASFALDQLDQSNAAFARAYPSSRPLALVGLLRANEMLQAGRATEAVPVCLASMRVLLAVKSGFEPGRSEGCLEALATQADATPEGEARQTLLRDMFLLSQLVQGSTTSRQIQQASARLSASRDPKVAEAMRAQQDAAAKVASITRRREALAQAQRSGGTLPYSAKDLDEEERVTAAEMATRESALQAAAPNYGQLVQEAVPAAEVFKALQPGEAFAGVTLTPRRGWTFLLRDGAIAMGRVRGGSGALDPLVTRIRAAMTPETPAFDTAAAEAVFKLVFGDVAPKLDGVRALTVAPSGSLLSLPFGVLLTGPGDPASLAAAPWLIKQAAIGHVPSAGNFVALRRVAGGSRAARPWFGFGDFKPVSLAQAERSFGPSCGDAAQLLSRLPPLPSARQELAIAAKLLGASPEDELLGPAFTVPAVQRLDLARYRVLHFATHAVLPSDLACQREPALITSPPPGAGDASGALLTASDLAQIKLDADLVILSACNSGGAEGKLGGGESLSALARSFFFGGARALLITHWEVSDQAATFIIADTLRRMRADPSLGPAAALAGVQSEMLTRTGSALPAAFAHPFYWAPFAIIGPAGTGAPAARS